MTSIFASTRHLPISQIGEPNPFPIFTWQQPIATQNSTSDVGLSKEEKENAFIWGRASILPYRVQDNYDRSQRLGELKTIVVENELVRLTLYPQYGGRLASIFDKQNEREILFDNPVFQPANLAILNAWFSGGIEWNGLTPGHTPSACSPVFVARVDTDKGPVLRLYEFDRVKEAAWQVDIFLPADEEKIWIHVRVINPNPWDIKCYWWTNIAAPLTARTRVLSPADYCIEHVLPDNHLERLSFPEAHGFDGTYPSSYTSASSVFFRQPGCPRPWIAAVEEDGRGILHCSTSALPARKMFTWGSSAGGQRWMDFLSRPGEGDYIEIQAGVCPTQNQEFPVRAGGQVEWTECLAPLALDEKLTHHSDFATACASIGTYVSEKIPGSQTRDLDAWLGQVATYPINLRLHEGAEWGGLHEELTSQSISPGLDFSIHRGDSSPWRELLREGTFSESLKAEPMSWMVSPRWVSIIKASAENHGSTWLHELYLGIVALDQGSKTRAGEHLISSLALKPTALAYRCRAVLQNASGAFADALSNYLQAWQLLRHPALAIEICELCQTCGFANELANFLVSLPPDLQKHEKVRLATARLAMSRREYALVEDILNGEFVFIREGETTLTDLWFGLRRGVEEARLNRPLDEQETSALRKENPLPAKIDFRMIL